MVVKTFRKAIKSFRNFSLAAVIFFDVFEEAEDFEIIFFRHWIKIIKNNISKHQNKKLTL